jgi:hypothetical protein
MRVRLEKNSLKTPLSYSKETSSARLHITKRAAHS